MGHLKMAIETKCIMTCDICGKEIEFSRHPWFSGWKGTRVGFWKQQGFKREKHKFDLCNDCYDKMIEFCKKGVTNGEVEKEHSYEESKTEEKV